MSTVRTLRCVKFSEHAFIEEVRSSARVPASAKEAAQVRYLASYLAHPSCGARTILVEHPYTDRHYLQEYEGYYATCLRPPPSCATRLHLFASEIDDAQLDEEIVLAAQDEASFEAGEARLQQAYLGFIVVRPLPSVPIGRSVLRTYRDVASRVYASKENGHRVHLAGFALSVNGVQFCQQDIAVGACATAALWSALARVTRNDGGRAPSPLQVTRAATKYRASGRVVPATEGLDAEQIVEAIRSFGYEARFIRIGGDAASKAAFLMVLKCYVNSGIPLILRVDVGEAQSSHAVVVVGYRRSDTTDEADCIETEVSDSRTMLSSGVSRLYIHDDRIGPYARALWSWGKDGDYPVLQIHTQDARFKEFESECRIFSAFVPVYPKVRLDALDLRDMAVQLFTFAEFATASARGAEALQVELQFALEGSYRKEGMRLLGSRRAAVFARTARLSRYVGVIRFGRKSGEPLIDFVCDTTDFDRAIPSEPPVVAVICYAGVDDANVRRYSEVWGGTPSDVY